MCDVVEVTDLVLVGDCDRPPAGDELVRHNLTHHVLIEAEGQVQVGHVSFVVLHVREIPEKEEKQNYGTF